MATFDTCIRNIKSDGYATVYIRVIHNREISYIKTSLVVGKKQIKGMKVKDNYILTQTSVLIREFIEKINRVDIRYWSCDELMNYLNRSGNDISFTDFVKTYVRKLSVKGKDSSAAAYHFAFTHFQRFIRKENVLFSDISSLNLSKWLETLENTKNAKEKYPILLKTLFNAGLLEYNDYDNGNLLIKHQPFIKLKIAKTDLPAKRNLDKPTLKRIFEFDCSKSIKEVRTPLAKDVALLVFCLVGINTADLYLLGKSSLTKDWKLCYNRVKTKDRRADKSYIEITIPERIKYLFDKYKGKDHLFNFAETYYSHQQFNKSVNVGLKDISNRLELPETVTSYYFRHSWANIAKNQFKASDEIIAFCLNHASAHKITEKYFDKNFGIIDSLNKKIIDYVLK